jgi:hypothetical protein
MNFADQGSKLLTNKYFLYFIVFLAVSNVLGYLVTNKVNAVIFFALIAFLMTNFSKNMSVILLVAIFATNLLMANKTMREGLENASVSLTDEEKAAIKDSVDTDKLDSVDHELGQGLDALKTTGNTEEAKQKLKEKKESVSTNKNIDANIDMDTHPIVDPNNRTLNQKTTETEAFKVKGKSGFSNGKKSNSSLRDAAPVNGNSRIDYATTLEDAYDNLDKILGSDGINKLTNDTQKLMMQQQKLFDTMENMVPMINTAKEMMGSIDMSQLGGLANLASSLGSEKQ